VTRLIGGVGVCLLANIQNGRDANWIACIHVYKDRRNFAAILHAQGTMTNRVVCSGGESIGKTAICFSDDQ